VKTRQRRRWLAASTSCLLAVCAISACGETTPSRGGLMLVVSSDGPLMLDRLQLEVSADERSLLSNNYRVPKEVELPTTVAIVSNGDATAQAKISVTGWAAGVPLDRRDAIVTQIPADRVATFNVVLSARCSEKLTVDAEGNAVSTCGDGNTCDNFGACVSATIQATELPTYHAGDENDAGLGGGPSVNPFGGSSAGGSSSGGNGHSGSPVGDGGASMGGNPGGDTGSGTGGEPPSDPCAGMACDDPPAADCLNASQFKSYDTPGSCAVGKCRYKSHVITCDCEAGACKTDPCASLTCTNSVCVGGACQGVCAPPQTRCNGVVPQTCSASGGWHDEAVTANVCGAQCTPGTTQCAGLNAQQTCSQSGTCPAAAACTNQTCVGSGVGSACTGVCAQGQTKCTNADLQSCTTAGTWGTATTCPAPQTCQTSACACPASTPNLCNDNCTNYQNDKFNCGVCGHSCQGASCSGGVCQPFALFTSSSTLVNIAVSSSTVYWTDSSTGVNSIPTGGGSTGWVTFGGGCGVMGLALDSTNIYGVARDGGCNGLAIGRLMAAPLAGGAATQIVASLGNASYPPQTWRFLAVDAANVYFTNYDIEDASRIAKSGGTATKLTDSQMLGGIPKGVAVQGTNVYWGTSGKGIAKQPVAGGSIVTIAASADGNFLAVDGSYVYYSLAGALMKALTSGSTPTTLVASGAAGPLVIDANNVYYLGSSTVMMVSKLGGTPTTLASGQSSMVDIAVDATSVYWLAGKAVMKRAL